MNFKIMFLIAALGPMKAQAWEVFQEKEDDGRVFTIAEQAGDAGAFLRLVCFEKKIHLEVIFPKAIEPVADTVELFQIDDRPERLVAGFIDEIDASTSIFVGVDRRDEPAASTKALVDQMAAGQEVFLGDPDAREAIERWSLQGSRKAIDEIRKKCS
ncbi:MAG: hypothetical protein P8H69_03745 [Planktomarina sp.]|jgi:hypothetical protein|nr:hypothetical protein [Paracoccaceae bacterium]MDG0984642.1 hypothetical protein [Planktomarina sp.]MDG1744876.1 hypothetical protein [Planktomarina sp.]